VPKNKQLKVETREPKVSLLEALQGAGKQIFKGRWDNNDLSTAFTLNPTDHKKLSEERQKLEKEVDPITTPELERFVNIAEITGDMYQEDEDLSEYYAKRGRLLQYRKILEENPSYNQDRFEAYSRKLELDTKARDILWQGKVTCWRIGQNGEEDIVKLSEWMNYYSVLFPTEAARKVYRIDYPYSGIFLYQSEVPKLFLSLGIEDAGERMDDECQEFLKYFLETTPSEKYIKPTVMEACALEFKSNSGKRFSKDRFETVWSLATGDIINPAGRGRKPSETRFNVNEIRDCIVKWRSSQVDK